jgi:hypothetical protein
MQEAEPHADPPTQAAPILRAGELPLVVFVSSVMDEEMSQPHKDAQLALDAPFLVPWAFESTPANPDPADWTYLSKAASADALLWLVGSCTTEPVRREVHVARENNVPLFVIRLDNATRDEDTEGLIGDLGLSVKCRAGPVLTAMPRGHPTAVRDGARRHDREREVGHDQQRPTRPMLRYGKKPG